MLLTKLGSLYLPLSIPNLFLQRTGFNIYIKIKLQHHDAIAQIDIGGFLAKSSVLFMLSVIQSVFRYIDHFLPKFNAMQVRILLLHDNTIVP